MKKFLAVLLTIAVLGISVVPVAAVETTENIVAVYEDGSYLVEEIVTTTSDVSPWSSTIATSGYRTVTLYNGSDVAQWDYTLYANFLYREGVSSQVQNRWDDYNVYNSQWSMVEHSTSLDITTAYGYYKFKKTVLFITTVTESDTIGLTCDAYGNITRV